MLTGKHYNKALRTTVVDTVRKVTEVNSMVDDVTVEIGPLKERSLYSNWSGTFAEKV